MQTLIDQARQRCPLNPKGKIYNQYGLAYSLPHLRSVAKKYLKGKMNKEALCDYVDVVTLAFTDIAAERSQLPNVDQPLAEYHFQNLNITSIGNIAYVAQFAKDATIRSNFARYLADIHKRAETKTLRLL